MRNYKIAFLEGDGIGPVLNKKLALLLEQLGKSYGFFAECINVPFGKSAFLSCGTAMPENTISAVLDSNAAIVCGVDAKGVPGATPVGLLRRNLGLYADVRIIRSREGCWAVSPNIDMVVIRDLTQGFLSDRNLYQGNGEWMSDKDTAFSLRVITYSASRQIAKYAFDYAEVNGRKKITALHKASIFKMTCGTFLRACRDEAELHPSIEYTEEVIDNAANKLITHPQDYDILLTTNLFGDIISDEAAALVSSLAPSINYGPNAAVYLPVNNNPAYKELETNAYDLFPALLCLHMMLRDIGESKAAEALDILINRFVKTKSNNTSDLFNKILFQVN